MVRLIDADVFKENMDYVADSGGNMQTVSKAVTEYVKMQIDAQTTVEAPHWIPFFERKPDTGAHILITVLWEKGVDTDFDDDYEVMEEDWGVGEYEIKEGTATPLMKRIHERAIAWMELPKPYERKEE